ncbi:hypothetical protein [Halobacteriovorax sp. ZH2_bin.1]|uniref:hypothetical protein n=1 Tax=unclassified Halobacteriovorax TaxID=2639665 RepID=UPI0037100C32
MSKEKGIYLMVFKNAIFTLIVLSMVGKASASEFYNTDIYDGPLVYKPEEVNKAQKNKVTDKETTERVEKNPTVKNKSYLNDPKQDRFWREGNHVPDEGWLELAKDPSSVEKAKAWLLRMDTKRKVLYEMSETIEKAQLALIAEGKLPDLYNEIDYLQGVSGVADKRLSKSAVNDALKGDDTYIFFITDPTCSNCEAQAKHLVGIRNVFPFQVRGGRLKNYNGLAPTKMIDAKVKEGWFGKGSAIPTPQLIITKVRNGKNVGTKLIGVQSVSEISTALGRL